MKIKLRIFFTGLVLTVLIFPFAAEPQSEVAKNAYVEHLRELGINFEEGAFLAHAASGDLEVVRLFLAAGIRPDAKNQNGESAVELAGKNGHTDTVRLLVESGANVDGLVKAVVKSKEKEKDFWDKLSSFSSIGTVLASLIIAGVGWYFTKSYNLKQNELLEQQNKRNSDLKEQENRILEMETIEKMIPHLTKDENTKRTALLAISSLARPELAAKMAELYAGEGSVRALGQIAAMGSREDKRQAVSALSNIASSVTEGSETALTALNEIFMSYKDAVVKIQISVRDNNNAKTVKIIASGFIVSEKGHILTAGYIFADGTVLDEEKIEVQLSDGSYHDVDVIDIDQKLGLSLLKIEGKNFKIIKVAEHVPGIDTKVIAIGSFMGGAALGAKIGVVKAYSGNVIQMEFDSRDSMEFSGGGGGPILNSSGEAVAMIFESKINENTVIVNGVRCDVAKQYFAWKAV